MDTQYKFDVLLVEDNPGDVRLIKEALKESRLLKELHVVEDGIEAMAFLYKKDRYQSVATPHLILLDLNLPKKDGRKLLREIKSDDLLRKIPVVVLSSSESPVDIVYSYNNNANCYISKPLDLDQFNKAVSDIENFWLGLAKLPLSNNNGK